MIPIHNPILLAGENNCSSANSVVEQSRITKATRFPLRLVYGLSNYCPIYFEIYQIYLTVNHTGDLYIFMQYFCAQIKIICVALNLFFICT